MHAMAYHMSVHVMPYMPYISACHMNVVGSRHIEYEFKNSLRFLMNSDGTHIESIQILMDSPQIHYGLLTSYRSIACETLADESLCPSAFCCLIAFSLLLVAMPPCAKGGAGG